jgi:hypothetical protein
MKLLLIDKSLREINYNALINARKEDVEYVLFNSREDTYASLKNAIIEKANNVSITDIALVQHSNLTSVYTICYKETSLLLDEVAPYASYIQFRDWLADLKQSVGCERFDMLA